MTTITSSSIGSDPATNSFDQPLTASERSNNISATVDRIASGAHQAVDRVAAVANSAANHLSVKGEDLSAAKDRWAPLRRPRRREDCSSWSPSAAQTPRNPPPAICIALASLRASLRQRGKPMAPQEYSSRDCRGLA